LFFASLSTLTLKSSHKSKIVGAHRRAHKIKLRESNDISNSTKFLPGSRWFLGYLEFLTKKCGNLSLQESELGKVARSGTGRLPLSLVRVSLIKEAQLVHGLGSLGETDTDPAKDKADHHLTVLTAATDPFCPCSLESDSEYDREVYMVEQGGELLEKTVLEIQREAEEEIPRAEHLARKLDKTKGHNGMPDDFEASEDEHPDGTPTWRHHPKFNSRCHTDRD
jgi:hypothetical protein